jgi:dienelactone hydrolase
MRRFARHLTGRGIGAAVIMLPYHMRRLPAGERGGRRFRSRDVDQVVQALSQSASDVSTVARWLSRQPSVDPQRIGVIGISLGAIVAHLAMGRDERLTAGVGVLGGGDLAELYRASLAFKLGGRSSARSLSPEEVARLWQVDPLRYAGRNRPRKVLMIQAARDLLIPPRNALTLWQALGRPPIQWVDTNHFGLSLAPRSVMKVSGAYLQLVWSGSSPDAGDVPTLRAPTVKLGLLLGLDAANTPALQWQAYSFASRRDHLSGLHADLGWSGRGPFVGLAATLNPFVDLGLGHRCGGGRFRPYVSLHVVF